MRVTWRACRRPARNALPDDGTWNTPDQIDHGKRVPTNVVKLARTLKPDASDGTPQIVYYHEGVGTRWGFDRIFGGAFGTGISRNICDAYRFLIDNYELGDELFLFGFSRGAYTVRSLAGLIRNCGLLQKRYADKLPDAYALYRDRRPETSPRSDLAQAFREEFAREIRIKCIGVWDTVGALGVPLSGFRWLTQRNAQFHDVTLSSYVDNAFQALAIDEHRKPFTPAVWDPQDVPGQTVEQAWFAGAHSNVGGGYPDARLSDLALSWMKERAQRCGLEFDEAYFAQLVSSSIDGTLRNSMTIWYRLLGQRFRPIAHQARNRTIDRHERVDPSAIERHETVTRPPQGPYRPPNLLAYLRRKAREEHSAAKVLSRGN